MFGGLIVVGHYGTVLRAYVCADSNDVHQCMQDHHNNCNHAAENIAKTNNNN